MSVHGCTIQLFVGWLIPKVPMYFDTPIVVDSTKTLHKGPPQNSLATNVIRDDEQKDLTRMVSSLALTNGDCWREKWGLFMSVSTLLDIEMSLYAFGFWGSDQYQVNLPSVMTF